MQNSVISTRITSFYVSQPSSSVFACKTAHFGPELQISKGPRPHLLFWSYKTTCLAQESKDYIGSSSRLWFCACKTATLGLELQYLLVKVHPCCFCMQNCDFGTRITSLYGSQTWPVVLWMYNSVFNIRITSLYGFQTSSVVLSTHNSVLSTRIKRLCSSPHLCLFSCKTPTLGPDLQVCMGPRPHLWFWAHITACLTQE